MFFNRSVKIEATCEVCNKAAKVEMVYLNANGTINVHLSCGHVIFLNMDRKKQDILAELVGDKNMTEENKLKEHLGETFPRSAPYKMDPLEFALSYIREIRKWATDELGVEEFKEE